MPTVPPTHAFPFGVGGLPRDLLGARGDEDAAGGGDAADVVARDIAAAFVRAPITVLLGDQGRLGGGCSR